MTSDAATVPDEELVAVALGRRPGDAGAALEALFSRYSTRVIHWCLKVSGSSTDAEDLAQEVFLRVQEHLPGFREEARFSTWLYTVTRSVAINRAVHARRRRMDSLDVEGAPEPPDPSRSAEEAVVHDDLVRHVREALREELDPLEAKVIHLHLVDGLTLPAVGALLGLTNASGAKAYVVSAKRKLRRRFERLLARTTETPAPDPRRVEKGSRER